VLPAPPSGDARPRSTQKPAARLVVKRIRIDSLVAGQATHFDGSQLTIDATSLRALALAASGDALADVTVELAGPGDSSRIVHVLDALPALARTDGQGRPFPGFLGAPQPSARGGIATFSNLAVLTCAELPWGAGGLLIARESSVDMSGPLSKLNPFGSTFNVVLRIDLTPGRADIEYEAAVRRAGLAVAEGLGTVATTSATPGQESVYELAEADPSLPRVAYIYQVHSQGLHARTFLYGKELEGLVPMALHPNELLEGAVVSGNYVYGAFKTPTWLHVNNPVVERLYAGHGRDHNFVGVVLSRGHHYSAWEKERSANLAAHQAFLLGADGVALTWEGGGNSITDAMLTIRACERLGIRTAAVSYEMGEEDAADVILLDAVAEADALVSSGNTSRKVTLPRVERVLGGADLRLRPEIGGEHVPAEGPLPVENDYLVYCAAGQTGFGTRAGVAY
jgi:glycine reductase complex component B subunit alpha and beta